MNYPSFMCAIRWSDWNITEHEARELLLNALELTNNQCFSPHVIKASHELVFPDIQWNEDEIELIVRCKIHSYEDIAKKLIEEAGGIQGYIEKEGGWLFKSCIKVLVFFNQIDWEETLKKTKKNLSFKLSENSLSALQEEVHKNLKIFRHCLNRPPKSKEKEPV